MIIWEEGNKHTIVAVKSSQAGNHVSSGFGSRTTGSFSLWSSRKTSTITWNSKAQKKLSWNKHIHQAQCIFHRVVKMQNQIANNSIICRTNGSHFWQVQGSMQIQKCIWEFRQIFTKMKAIQAGRLDMLMMEWFYYSRDLAEITNTNLPELLIYYKWNPII